MKITDIINESNLNEFVPPGEPGGGGENDRSRRLKKLLEIAIQVAKEKNVDELGMIHAMNMIAGDDFFNTAVEGILPDITDKEYMDVLQTAYKTVKQGMAEGRQLDEQASKLLSAEDKDGVITIIVQAPDGTKRSVADTNPNTINKWLMKYGLRLPVSITSKFVGVTEGMTEAEKTAKVFHPQYVDVYFLDGPRRTPLLVNRKVPYNLIDRYLEVAIKKYNLQKGRFEFRNAEEDPVAEGEGNFVGDFPQPNIGGATVKPMQVGDTVSYFGQTAKIQAQSPDRKHSRIEITKGTGGVVQTVLTSDLKRVHRGMAEEIRPTTGQAMGIRSQIAQKMNPDNNKFIWKRPNQIMGSHTENELRALKFRYSAKHNSWGGTQQMWGSLEGTLKEFAPSAPRGADRGGGNYFKSLAQAWYYNGVHDGDLQGGVKTQQDVERLLQRGIVCPDGVTRKFGIDYNSGFNGVVISSDDYYEHSDHGKRPGTMIDVRTGRPWGPYDYMEFSEDDLDESLNEFAPIKPPTAGAFGGNKDYGQPTSSRYIGGNKFVLGTTNNYVLTATVDKWGLEWDEDDEIWFLDSPGAAHIADATEGEIELPAPQEQRNQIHDLVTDYLNDHNSAELQRVAAYYGHSADGEMATSEGIRVPAQQILGTKNRAKSAYYPTNVKPKVPKLDTPLTDKELTRLSQLAGINQNK